MLTILLQKLMRLTLAEASEDSERHYRRIRSLLGCTHIRATGRVQGRRGTLAERRDVDEGFRQGRL